MSGNMSQYKAVKASFEKARRHIVEKSLVRDVGPARRAILKPNRRLTHTVAKAFPLKGTVQAGKVLLDIPQDPETLFQTMLHEFAHLLAPLGSGHGPKFKAVCRQIGCGMVGATTKGYRLKGLHEAKAEAEGLPSWCFAPTSRRTCAFFCSVCRQILWSTKRKAERIARWGAYCIRCKSSITPLTDAGVESFRNELKKEATRKGRK